MDEAMWVYSLVIDYVDARLAYFEEELFYTLRVDVEEEYVLKPGARVWMRIASIESAQTSAS